MNNFLEMFSYAFMVRALIVGVLLSLSAALVGVPLVLRKNSMISDGLSHVGFGPFAIAALLGLTPLWFALPVVILTSFFILRLNENNHITGDSAIALISTSALAIGTFVVSLSGSNVDINNYLFGSILSLGTADIIAGIILSILVIGLYIICHHKIFAVTFDEPFAKSIGIKTGRFNMIFAILCSVVIVLGMRLMGALLISSLIVFPVLSAKQVAKSYKSVVLLSAIFAVLAFVSGLIISYLLNTPTGATVVLTSLVFFIFSNLLKKIL